MARHNALSLLLNYESDSDKDSGYTSEEERKRKNTFFNIRERKAKRSKIDHEEMAIAENESVNDELSPQIFSINSNPASIDQQSSNQLERLIPLPEEFLNTAGHIDDPTLHEGKIRSFPHVRGNWSSIIFIPITFGIFNPHLKSLVSSLITTAGEHSLELFQASEYHISLSLTFILRLEWIQPLVEDLRSRLSKCKKFSMWLHGLDVFCNEERTRTFLVVKVGHGRNEMKEIAEIAAESLKKYSINSRYEELSFHASIAWCLGNKMEELKQILPLMQNVCDQYFYMESDMRTFDVGEIHIKTGNRIHQIPLSS